jgi:hypothetical protein
MVAITASTFRSSVLTILTIPSWKRFPDDVEADALGTLSVGEGFMGLRLAASPRAAGGPAGGWPPEGRIVMTP